MQKEPAGSLSPEITGKPATLTDSVISIQFYPGLCQSYVQKEPAALLPDVTGTDMPAYSNRLLHKNSICSGWRQSLCAVEQYLDESTKWLYAEEKMQKYGCSTLRRKKL